MAGPKTHSGTEGRRVYADPAKESFVTAANYVTAVRTVATVCFAGAGIMQKSLTLLLISVAIYWIGDSLDGEVARRMDRETRIGAVFDILCDRLSAAAFYLSVAWLYPHLSVPILIYLTQFMVIDCFLSLSFLAWPLCSPNYFYVVDHWIWKWNWSRPAKAVNSGAFAIILLVTQSVVLGVVIAAGLFALKSWSVVRLARLGLPIPPRPADHAVDAAP
jgi:CDP-diacylglycerol---glycerol-3-phosphate 3-phosphatidyltransferase